MTYQPHTTPEPLAGEQQPVAADLTADESLPCPFCGCTDISDGEGLTMRPDGSTYTQSECQGCGAVGPRGDLMPGVIDYGSVAAIRAWNRRAALGSAPATPVPASEPFGYYIHVPAEQRGEFVFDLDEALDDLTNCECDVTELRASAPATPAPIEPVKVTEWIEEALTYVGSPSWSPSLEREGRDLLAKLAQPQPGTGSGKS